MPTRLKFNEGNHSYYLSDPRTGRKERIVAVTTLLNQLAKPALTKWAARKAADYALDNWDALAREPMSKRRELIAGAAEFDRDAKAASGTAIHSMAEKLLTGQPVDVPADLLPKVQSLARFWERAGMTVVAQERLVWSDFDEELDLVAYGGRFDLLVQHPAAGLGLLDLKTGSGVYDDMALQLGAYAGADFHVIAGEDRNAPPIVWAGVLHVRPDRTVLHTLGEADLDLAKERFDLLRALRAAETPGFQQQA